MIVCIIFEYTLRWLTWYSSTLHCSNGGRTCPMVVYPGINYYRAEIFTVKYVWVSVVFFFQFLKISDLNCYKCRAFWIYYYFFQSIIKKQNVCEVIIFKSNLFKYGTSKTWMNQNAEISQRGPLLARVGDAVNYFNLSMV